MPNDKRHSLIYDNNALTVKGVTQVVAISEKEASLKIDGKTLVIRGSGLNVTRLDKEEGVVAFEVTSVSSMTYRSSGAGLTGLFK